MGIGGDMYEPWMRIRPGGEIQSEEERLYRLERRLWADNVWLRVAKDNLHSAKYLKPESVPEMKRDLKARKSRVDKLRRLIKIVEERIDRREIDALLCPVCLNEGHPHGGPDCPKCGR